MIVVIADDFSGASEIAGIGWRYGLSTEVQLEFNPASNANLIVVDADTRSQNSGEAIQRTNDLSKRLKDCGRPIALFKKVDSVFRGYIFDEINTLHKHFHFDRVLLLPANPSRNRKIISGQYIVNDIPLDKTVFASDPHFPASTSFVEKIIAGYQTILPHVHLEQNDTLPIGKLITGDVISREDIKHYVKQTSGADLCCGGAECFEAYLENKGYVKQHNERLNKTDLMWPSYTLIISGSTVREQFGHDDAKENLFPLLSLPGQWKEDEFVLERNDEEAWHREVYDCLHKHNLVAVAVNQEVKRINKASDNFSNYFARLVNYISEKTGKENIHLAITGGETALEIIKNEGLSFKVHQEIAPGIVTLASKQPKKLFTVKPGSYLWPSEFIKSLIRQQ